MIKITVSGDRGEGKTVTALRIVHMLRALGFTAEYQGGTARATELLQNQTPEELVSLLDASSGHRSFKVIDKT